MPRINNIVFYPSMNVSRYTFYILYFFLAACAPPGLFIHDLLSVIGPGAISCDIDIHCPGQSAGAIYLSPF